MLYYTYYDTNNSNNNTNTNIRRNILYANLLQHNTYTIVYHDSIHIYIHIYIYIYIYICIRTWCSIIVRKGGRCGWRPSSSSNLSFRALRARISQFKLLRACPLVQIRQAVPCRAIRGKSSESRQQYLSQQYPPPPLNIGPWTRPIHKLPDDQISGEMRKSGKAAYWPQWDLGRTLGFTGAFAAE